MPLSCVIVQKNATFKILLLEAAQSGAGCTGEGDAWYCQHFRCWYLYSICIFVFEVRIKGKGHPVQNVALSILANLDTLDEKITIQIS